MELTAAVLGLGLAGLDPIGALIAIGALARGMPPRWVAAYGVVVLLATALLGTLLSVTVGRRLAEVDWAALLPQGGLGAAVELVAAVVLLVWACLRTRRPTAAVKKPRRQPAAGPALIGAGLLFAGSAVLDPTFGAVVVILGRGEPVWQVVVGNTLWVLISQLPLAFVLVTIALGRHQRATAWFQRWWERSRSTVGHVVTGALVVAGLTLAADAVWFLLTGAFLLPGP